MTRARNLGVWTQRIAIAAVIALIVGFAVRVGSSSSQSLDFRDPLIWLASNATGDVVQADAGSGEVTARVEVGSDGDSLQVVQHGADALVLNRTSGELARINGSLLAVAERSPVTVDDGARLLAHGDHAAIVTASTVIPVDPSNAELGTTVDIPGLASAVIDGDGSVWGLDPDNNVLVVTDGVAEVRVPTETRPFAIATAGDDALLLDGAGPVLRELESPTSGLGGNHCVGGAMDADVAIGGSVESGGHVMVMVDTPTGTVRMSDVAEGRCTSAELDDVTDATFGASVESGGVAYVPILSTGEVAIVRVAEGTVVNRVAVTPPDRPIELTVKDGTVWFNDPTGPEAGVLGVDRVIEVDKYKQVQVSAENAAGEPGDDQQNPGTNTSGSAGENAGSETEPGPGDPGSTAADGSSGNGGGENQSVGSNGDAEGPVEDADLSGLVADFTFSKRVVEVGESVTFVDRSQGGPVAWTWDFADGSFSTGPETEHSWDAVGAYRVTLRIESATGTAAASATIEVIDENTRSRPNADFRFSASRVEVGQPVTFTDRSTGNATELAWDFGDGTAAAGPTVDHSWTAAGTYRVALTATNALGSDTSAPATITVYDRVEQPTAVIVASAATASVNQTVTFSSRSTGNPTELSWDFGDGTSARGESVSHGWSEPGTYTVRLRVANSAGESSATTTVTVDERVVAPIARLVASVTTAEERQVIRFTSLSTNNPTRLTWDFGDGSTDSGTAVTHAYDKAGRYTVMLRASNAAGEAVATTTIVVVSDVPAPVAAFSTSPESPLTADTPVQFLDQSTGGAATSWEWDFGDGTAGSSMRNPTHVFTDEGTYTVRLVVENGGGRDDVTRQIVVRPPTPVADFTFTPSVPNAGQSVQFTDASRNVTTGTTWLWNFGDGTATSTERNPRHTFAQRDSYVVTLTVTNAGGSSTTTRTIEVNPRAPAANFSFSPTSNITTVTAVQFTFRQANNTGDPDTFLWNFGDGTTSSERNPSKTFTRAGSFPVTLTVTNAGGTNTSPAQTVRVTVPPPTASFTVPATPRIAGTPITFTNTSTGGPFDTVTWNWDDGTPNGSGNTPSHTFAAAGTYRVRITVANPGGSDTVRVDVRVYAVVNAEFTAPATVASGANVNFNNTSTGAETYAWNFGDGTTSTATNPTKSYVNTTNAPVPYPVTLTARNAGGSEETVTRTVTVNPAVPVASFTYASGGGDTVQFTSTSVGGASYSWDFDDGGTATGANPSHVFEDDGPFDVTLTVTNPTGSNSVTIRISMATPTVDFTFAPASPNEDQNVTFTNASSGGPFSSITWSWGDGTAGGSGNSATHRFADPGSYVVRLTVTNGRGSFSVEHTVVVG
jgi:PKD repeat protein